MSLFGHDEQEARRIVTAGAGNIGIEDMQPKTRFKIIEADREGAIASSEQLSTTIVALDQKSLMQTNIQDTDLIVMLTNNDQMASESVQSITITLADAVWHVEQFSGFRYNISDFSNRETQSILEIGSCIFVVAEQVAIC